MSSVLTRRTNSQVLDVITAKKSEPEEAYVVVNWEGTISYSVVPANNVIAKGVPEKDWEGKSFKIRWLNRKILGTVMGIGSESEMKALEESEMEKSLDEQGLLLSGAISSDEEDDKDEEEEKESSDDDGSDKENDGRSYAILGSVFNNQGPPGPLIDDGVDGRENGVDGMENGVDGRENGVDGMENGVDGRENGAEPQGSDNEDGSDDEMEKSILIAQLKKALVEKDKEIGVLGKKVMELEKDVVQLTRKLRKRKFVPTGEAGMEKIADGMEMDADALSTLKASYRQRPGMFLRKVMYLGGFFTVEEVASCSLSGQKWSGAGEDEDPRPPLDTYRISKLKEFTIKALGLNNDSKRMNALEKSMNNLCTDARKVLDNQVNPKPRKQKNHAKKAKVVVGNN